MSAQLGVCNVPLANGEVMTVTAKAHRQSGELAGFKAANGAAAVRARLEDVLLRARLEEREDQRWRVAVDIQPAPVLTDSGWELAAVLADRIARGSFQPTREQLWALGCFSPGDSEDAAGSAMLQALAPPGDAVERLRSLAAKDLSDAQIIVAGEDGLGLPTELENCVDLLLVTHLSNLGGHPDPGRLVRTAQVWFPGISGHSDNDRLLRVQVAARPVRDGRDDPLDILGLPVGEQARQVLRDARAGEPRGGAGWQTLVRFQRPAQGDFYQVDGGSWQLALVLADRIARGRDVPPRGRLIATGASSQWMTGVVENVEGIAEKCALIGHQLGPGDRILFPMAWQNAEVCKHLRAQAETMGSSCAAIGRI